MRNSEYDNLESRGVLMVSTQVRQSEGSWFKSRSGQIAYSHGVNTRLSTLWTGDVPRGSDSAQNSRACLRHNLGDIKERLEKLELSVPVYFGNYIGITVQIEDSRYAIWLPCPQTVWGAIRGGFIPKLLC